MDPQKKSHSRDLETIWKWRDTHRRLSTAVYLRSLSPIALDSRWLIGGLVRTPAKLRERSPSLWCSARRCLSGAFSLAASSLQAIALTNRQIVCHFLTRFRHILIIVISAFAFGKRSRKLTMQIISQTVERF